MALAGGWLVGCDAASALDVAGLARVQDRIAEFLASGAAGDNYLTYYDARLDKVVLNSNVPDADVSAALGSDRVAVALRSGGVIPLTRLSDFAPFWGGAAVTDGEWGCSLGFTVWVGSNEKMTTAGHCFDNNNVPVWSIGSLASMGTYSNRHCSSGQDGALIDGADYAPRVYIGGAASGTGYYVKGSGNPNAGVLYWWSGYKSSEQSETAISTSGSSNWGCGAATGLVVLQALGPNLCFGLEGDSGRPYIPEVGDEHLRARDSGRKGR